MEQDFSGRKRTQLPPRVVKRRRSDNVKCGPMQMHQLASDALQYICSDIGHKIKTHVLLALTAKCESPIFFCSNCPVRPKLVQSFSSVESWGRGGGQVVVVRHTARVAESLSAVFHAG